MIEFHPAKERPKTALLLAFSFGILAQALWQWVPPMVAIFLWTASVFSLRDFFLPTQYIFEESGILVRGPLKPTRQYAWHRFRTFQKDRNGIFLSPYHQKRATEAQRGVFLPLRPEQRNEVAEFCLQQGLTRRAA